MIHIDYQGGAHGNYLEFVCNKMANLTVGTPFNSLGASHAKQYTGKKLFYADHYSTTFIPFEFKKIISIQIEVEELLNYVKAPDFPTGGIIYGYEGVREALTTGRGRIVIRAKAEIEESNGREQIIITEIPYQVKQHQIENYVRKELVKFGFL